MNLTLVRLTGNQSLEALMPIMEAIRDSILLLRRLLWMVSDTVALPTPRRLEISFWVRPFSFKKA
jgi:hypothetical protein